MASPKTEGRMIRKRISDSHKFASLSPKAAVLFCMLIPHFNSHGKIPGGCGYIKDLICPNVPYLTVKNLPTLLKEINDKTNVKWFTHDGRQWLHSLNFLTEHQDLRKDRQGPDTLPDYSGTSPGLLPDHSGTTPGALPPEVEVEVKEKREGNSGALDEDLKPENPQPEESHQPDPCALADHSWRQFRAIMPLRNGKFLDEDACREKWTRTPALWNQWLAAAKNYAASREVAAGAVMSPVKFISSRWRDWQEPETLSGASPPGRAPDLSWMKNLEEDEKIVEQERQAGPKERPIPSWAQQTTT